MPLDESRYFQSLRIAVLKVKDNRTRTDDAAGDLLVQRATEAGHEIVHRTAVASDLSVLVEQLNLWIRDPSVDCVIAVGGTGLSDRDVTPEALALVWEREIPGFGELFRHLSYRSVGSSTIQSRACAGLANATSLFALPGSPGGVRDAWDGILAGQLDSRHKPCNLVEHLKCTCRS